MDIYSIDSFERDAEGFAPETAAHPAHEILPPEPEISEAEIAQAVDKAAGKYAMVICKMMSMAFKRANKPVTDMEDFNDIKDMFSDVFDYHPGLIKGGRAMAYLGVAVVPAMIVMKHMDMDDVEPSKPKLAPPAQSAKAEKAKEPEPEITPPPASGKGMRV